MSSCPPSISLTGRPLLFKPLLTREAPLGEVGRISQQDTIFLGQRLVLYRADRKKADDRFLLYSFLHEDLQGQIQSFGMGATVAHMRVPDAKKLMLNVPPLPIQRKIAGILGAYDDLIENNARRIQLLEQIAAALYREWFVERRFPGHETVATTKTELGITPQEWEWKKLGEVTLNFDSKRKPLSSLERADMKGIYPYYGAARVFDYIFDGHYLLLAEDGSVITKDNKPVLQLVNGKFWPNNHTHVLQGKPPVSIYFLYLFLSDFNILGRVTGAAQPKITQANLNAIDVLIPSTSLLEKFEGIIGPMLNLCDQLHKRNALLRQTRDVVLPRLLSGEVDVSELSIALDKAA